MEDPYITTRGGQGLPAPDGSEGWARVESRYIYKPPCPPDWLVDVRFENGDEKTGLAGDFRWGDRPHSSQLEIVMWRNLMGLDHSPAEFAYLEEVREKLDLYAGFSPVGELADRIGDILEAALAKVEALKIAAAWTPPNTQAQATQPAPINNEN